MGDKHKRPKWLKEPTPSKHPKSAPVSYQHHLPSWHFQVIDIGGPWCFKKMGDETFGRVLKALQDFENKKWSEIEGRQNHTIKLDALSNEARNRLIEIDQDDVEEVFSLRVTARERVVGIRSGAILRLLWWDPNHEVCPSELRNT
jgi:hypothetical protein